jgi:MFS family permease
MLLVAAASASFAAFHAHPWEVLAAMPLLGAGVGFAFAAMATLIVEAVRPEETGVATGMNTVMRTVGGVIGGQVGAALLTAYTLGRTRVPSVTGYEVTFALSAGVAIVGAALAVLVTTRRPRAVPTGAAVSIGVPTRTRPD